MSTLSPDVIASINENLYEVSGAWLWSTVDVYSQDYLEVYGTGPISLEAVTLAQVRFKADLTELVVRSGPTDTDPVIFSCEAMLLQDPPAPPTSSVTSVFGHSGDVLAASGDYSAYYPQLTASYVNPSWIAALDASKITTGTIDLARLPAMPSSNTIVCTTIPAMSAGDQLLVAKGTVVIESTTGNTYRYSGTGSVVLNASYIQQSDLTPDWATITNRPTNVSYWNNDAGYITSSANVASASKLATGRTLSITGDLSWTSPAFDGTTNVTAVGTLANTGVVAGSYATVGNYVPTITVDAKGRITGISNTAVIGDWNTLLNKPGTFAPSAHNHDWSNITGRTIGANPVNRLDSGWYEAAPTTTANGWPVNGSWWHLMSSTHSNGSNYFALQIAADFYQQDFRIRSTNGSGAQAWSTIWTSSNFAPGNYLPLAGGIMTGQIRSTAPHASNGQIDIGSTNQAGLITFRRGSDGGATGAIGYASATSGTDFVISSLGGSGTLRLGVLSGTAVTIGTDRVTTFAAGISGTTASFVTTGSTAPVTVATLAEYQAGNLASGNGVSLDFGLANNGLAATTRGRISVVNTSYKAQADMVFYNAKTDALVECLRLRGSDNVSVFAARPLFASNTPWDSGNLTGNQTAHYHSADRAWANLTGVPFKFQNFPGAPTVYEGFWPSGVTPTNDNFAIIWEKDNSSTYVSAADALYLQTRDGGGARYNRMTITDTAITASVSFNGTSAVFSGIVGGAAKSAFGSNTMYGNLDGVVFNNYFENGFGWNRTITGVAGNADTVFINNVGNNTNAGGFTWGQVRNLAWTGLMSLDRYGTLTASSFIKSGGGTGFLKADGTVDNNTYVTTGGSYLPLSAGSGKPLTGALYGTAMVMSTGGSAPSVGLYAWPAVPASRTFIGLTSQDGTTGSWAGTTGLVLWADSAVLSGVVTAGINAGGVAVISATSSAVTLAATLTGTSATFTGAAQAASLKLTGWTSSKSSIFLNSPSTYWAGIVVSGSGAQQTQMFAQVDANGLLQRRSDIAAGAASFSGAVSFMSLAGNARSHDTYQGGIYDNQLNTTYSTTVADPWGLDAYTNRKPGLVYRVKPTTGSYINDYQGWGLVSKSRTTAAMIVGDGSAAWDEVATFANNGTSQLQGNWSVVNGNGGVGNFSVAGALTVGGASVSATAIGQWNEAYTCAVQRGRIGLDAYTGEDSLTWAARNSRGNHFGRIHGVSSAPSYFNFIHIKETGSPSPFGVFGFSADGTWRVGKAASGSEITAYYQVWTSEQFSSTVLGRLNTSTNNYGVTKIYRNDGSTSRYYVYNNWDSRNSGIIGSNTWRLLAANDEGDSQAGIFKTSCDFADYVSAPWGINPTSYVFLGKQAGNTASWATTGGFATNTIETWITATSSIRMNVNNVTTLLTATSTAFTVGVPLYSTELHSTSAYAGTGLFAGTGDGATMTTYNQKLTSWHGTAIYDAYNNAVRGYINHRTGDLHMTGTISAYRFGNIISDYDVNAVRLRESVTVVSTAVATNISISAKAVYRVTAAGASFTSYAEGTLVKIVNNSGGNITYGMGGGTYYYQGAARTADISIGANVVFLVFGCNGVSYTSVL